MREGEEKVRKMGRQRWEGEKVREAGNEKRWEDREKVGRWVMRGKKRKMERKVRGG